jgi:hypothetical protein
MELLASGRTAEVFAWGPGRVLKLDRPEWSGMSTFEASMLAILDAAGGLPLARPHETLTVDNRTGVVLDRIDGPMLGDVIAAAGDDELGALAAQFVELHSALNERVLDRLPDLVTGLADGVKVSGLPQPLVDELLGLLDRLDDGRRALCHFDLHADNVIVGTDGWVVIDWITASSGPPVADFARTLVLDPPDSRTPRGRFMEIVGRDGLAARRLDRANVDAWIRVIAAARLAEGFEGEYAESLTRVASGSGR